MTEIVGRRERYRPEVCVCTLVQVVRRERENRKKFERRFQRERERAVKGESEERGRGGKEGTHIA